MPTPLPRLNVSGRTPEEVANLIGDLREAVVSRLVGGDRITSAEVSRVRRLITSRLRDPEFEAWLKEAVTNYAGYEFDRGVSQIDALVNGAGLAGALNLAPTTVDIAKGFITGPSKIVSIPGELLEQVNRELALAQTGIRTPQQVADRIARRFDVSAARAELITRNEGANLANIGSRARIAEVAPKAKEVGITMRKKWLHSSGKVSGFRANKGRARYAPRWNHKAMHGKTCPAPDGKFKLPSIGGDYVYEVQGPHDPILPASENIGCMCLVSAEIVRE